MKSDKKVKHTLPVNTKGLAAICYVSTLLRGFVKASTVDKTYQYYSFWRHTTYWKRTGSSLKLISDTNQQILVVYEQRFPDSR